MKTPSLFPLARIVAMLLLMFLATGPAFGAAAPERTTTPQGPAATDFAKAQHDYEQGQYHRAIPSFQAVMATAKDTNPARYLSAIHYLSLSYFKTGDYGNSTLYAIMGSDACVRLRQFQLKYGFEQAIGLNTFTAGRPGEAIGRLKASLPAFVKSRDYGNEALTQYYLGLSYHKLGQEPQALAAWERVAALFRQNHYVHPEVRGAFEGLIAHYGQIGDDKRQLDYVNELLQADAYMKAHYPVLFGRIAKQYGTAELVQLREEHSQLSTAVLLLLGLVCVSVAFLSYGYYRRWKAEAIALEAIPEMNRMDEEGLKIMTLEISPEKEAELLQKLEAFEAEKRYLAPDLSSAKVAQLLGTNVRYAAALIAKYRNKKMIEYLNDLKIDHLVGLLQQGGKYLNYTQKALGEEVGFGTTQHFRRSFSYRMGVGLSDYLEKLKEDGVVE